MKTIEPLICQNQLYWWEDCQNLKCCVGICSPNLKRAESPRRQFRQHDESHKRSPRPACQLEQSMHSATDHDCGLIIHGWAHQATTSAASSPLPDTRAPAFADPETIQRSWDICLHLSWCVSVLCLGVEMWSNRLFQRSASSRSSGPVQSSGLRPDVWGTCLTY